MPWTIYTLPYEIPSTKMTKKNDCETSQYNPSTFPAEILFLHVVPEKSALQGRNEISTRVNFPRWEYKFLFNIPLRVGMCTFWLDLWEICVATLKFKAAIFALRTGQVLAMKTGRSLHQYWQNKDKQRLKRKKIKEK